MVDESRWLVGQAGTDRGNDPPFGASVDGAILVWDERACINGVEIDALTPSTLQLNGIPQGAGERVLVAEVAADNIVKVREDRGPGGPPLMLIGPAADNPIYAYGPKVVKALLSFHAQTGRVVTLMPLTNKSRGPGPEYTVQTVGDQIVFQGSFAAVVEAPSEVNRAPNGATEIVLDDKGAVVAVK